MYSTLSRAPVSFLCCIFHRFGSVQRFFLCIGEPQFTLVYDQSRRTKTWVSYIYKNLIHIFFLFAFWHSFLYFSSLKAVLYFYSFANAMWIFLLSIVVTSMVRILRFCTERDECIFHVKQIAIHRIYTGCNKVLKHRAPTN